MDALTRRVQELERKLNEVGSDEGLQREIERLRQQKAALEQDIANRVAWRKHLGRPPAARLIELVTEVVRPVAKSMPEIEGLLGQIQLDRATAANLKPHIEVLRRVVGLLDKAVAETLPPVLVFEQKPFHAVTTPNPLVGHVLKVLDVPPPPRLLPRSASRPSHHPQVPRDPRGLGGL